MRPDFPIAIDSTMRAVFVSCGQKFNYQFIQNLGAKGRKGIDLHAGGAYAKGLEVARRMFYDNGATEDDALEAAYIAFTRAWGPEENDEPEHKKSYVNVLGALIEYFEQYPMSSDPFKPLKTDLGSMIEFSFSIPLEGTKHPQTGEPIIYFGRCDMVGELGDGVILVEDDKTTSALGQNWGMQWELRAQLTGYVWAARQHNIPAQGALVRGLSILKESYGHAQVITYRQQWEIDRWYSQLIRDINRMIRSWEEGYWDYNLDSTCSLFKSCPFHILCDVEHPEQWMNEFEERKWNPLSNDNDNG